MSENGTLQWEHYSLYIVTGDRREYVGSIIRAAFDGSWGVYVRGKLVRTLNSESAARKHLEAHAGPKHLEAHA